MTLQRQPASNPNKNKKNGMKTVGFHSVNPTFPYRQKTYFVNVNVVKA